MAKCARCGRTFEPRKTGRRKYCSEECAKEAQKDRFFRYYTENKEKHNKVCNEYNKTHREQLREYAQRFKEKHPEKNKEYLQRYKEKKKRGTE